MQEGLTSLMLATQNGYNDVIEALLNANANPNITENVSIEREMVATLLIFASLQTIDWTALYFAAKSVNLRIIKLLLTKGADTELKDKVTWPLCH